MAKALTASDVISALFADEDDLEHMREVVVELPDGRTYDVDIELSPETNRWTITTDTLRSDDA